MTFSTLALLLIFAAAIGVLIGGLIVSIRRSIRSRTWLFDVGLVVVLLLAAFFRFTGMDWDEAQHLHPDERFLTGVVASLHSVGSVSEYFDTANSSLNPNNRGAGFFVYGTLPIFMVRYAAEGIDWLNALQTQWGWIEQPMYSATGYDQSYLVGRALSAFADLGVIVLVYLIASRLFSKRVGLLAAAFSALTVMQIQQSHFWTVDNFANFFTLLSVYFALRVATYGRDPNEKKAFSILDFVWFGVAFGLSLASKISQPEIVVVQALLLPAAAAIRLWQLPREEREPYYSKAFWFVMLAGALSVVTFRIFQPYAFQGLGIGGWLSNIGAVWQQSQGLPMLERVKELGIALFGLNPHWVETMASLAAQVNGDQDWPPSMQWARRPLWFGLRNMVGWGLGWPLALLCLGGLTWAAWRLIKGDWRKPMAILWIWGVFYFLIQSKGFNPTMRYFLPAYPIFIIFGAWAVFELWNAGRQRARARRERWRAWVRPAAAVLGGVALVASLLWAWAFVQIYQQPVSRVEAARWIYENIPGPITIGYLVEGEAAHQPLPVSYNQVIEPGLPFVTNFVPQADGELTEIAFKYVLAPIRISLNAGTEGQTPLGTFHQVVDLEGLQPGDLIETAVEIPAELLADPTSAYQFAIQLPAGSGQVQLESAELRSSQLADSPPQALLDAPAVLAMGDSLTLPFSNSVGAADRLVLLWRGIEAVTAAPVDANVSLFVAGSTTPLASIDTMLETGTDKGEIGTERVVALPQAQPVAVEQALSLQITVQDGWMNLQGGAVANETSWDDGLPLRLDGYDGFGGIYQNDLNFEMYWDDDAAKEQRFLNILNHSEYLFITSSRQWGSLPRIPERFPLVVAYYRALIGCEEPRSVESCFIDAQVGSVNSQSGFELVQVFENAPLLGAWQINDQAAEEAYTVYDHPKVFVFRKTADYDAEKWAEVFDQVDLSQVVRLTPKQASGRIPPNLMLPPDRLEQQREGGTWSELFDTDNWINSSPWVSAIVWYVALTIFGVALYPLVRWLLPGLRDRGYPFARLAGLILLAYLAWMGGSLGLTFSRGWLLAFTLLLMAAGGTAAWFQRDALREEWKTKRGDFLRAELLFLVFFAIMLAIRAANPDLWHPGYGGEKPMDFSYFNAVLKSTSFPPYDPWFSGGYINYYYYGFVLVGSWTKLLGAVPAVAYNLILPTLFAMLALGAYSLAGNLWNAWRGGKGRTVVSPEAVGLMAAVAVVLLGNLGSLGTLLTALAKLGAEGAYSMDAGVIQQLGWIVNGFVLSLGGQTFPIGTGEWYWNPTRIIPVPQGETGPITEFPLFTFTYADLHAHMIALPVTLLALAWSASALLSRAWNGLKDRWQAAASLAFGVLVLGSLRPINTWDLPTYLIVAALAVGYAMWRYGTGAFGRRGKGVPSWVLAIVAAGALVAVSFAAYAPFSDWYRQGYSSVQYWAGSRTPSWTYLMHWGIFLFFIVAWLAWETRQWMAETPLSSVRKLQPFASWLLAGVLLVLAVLVIVLFPLGVHIAWLVLPLLLWVGLLFLRQGQDLIKRVVLFMIGTALFLTLMVELIVLKGDISRMNTVFKFYMQAWVLLALGAAMGLAWTLEALPRWAASWRSVWRGAAFVLLVCGSFFLLNGTWAKLNDRMADDAPRTLDGLAYMQYSVYYDRDQMLELRQDYEAIRWMQENVQGSPVIVEAHAGEYRWGSRFAINTGLPAVIGWNWHQRQQREFVPGNDIWARVGEVEAFYTTTDLNGAVEFLRKYDVKYIIVGQLELAYYPGAGLEKFAAQDGILWQAVYQADDTVIYEVLDSTLAGE